MAEILFAAGTDVGLRRPNNEDSHAVLAGADGETYIVILADGMGGHQSGELASGTAVRYVRERITSELRADMDTNEIRAMLERIVEKANVHVYLQSRSSETCHDMGTTLTVALIRGDRMVIGHVGDCRCYLYREPALRQLTADHTLVQLLVNRGKLTAEQARLSPKKNEVTRALGAPEFVKADMIETHLEKGDRLLFSSDGLHDYVEEGAIRDILAKTPTPRKTVYRLISLANSTAGVDNVTCIVGFVQ